MALAIAPGLAIGDRAAGRMPGKMPNKMKQLVHRLLVGSISGLCSFTPSSPTTASINFMRFV